MSTETRANLGQRLVEAFSAQKEVYHIHFFGREAEGCSDRYSDIDMVACSNDLVATKTNYRDVFASIAPIQATLRLGGTSHSYSEMVLLEGYSPYHKVDFTIGDNTLLDQPVVAARPNLIVYENRQQWRESRTKLEPVEPEQDVEHVLTDILFSVARFTKCLFRRDLDMYRRWESISNATLVALYEKHFGWERETSKRRLGSSEIRHLCENLTPAERAQVQIIRPPDARLDLVLSYKACIEMFIELSQEKAKHFGVALDYDLIDFTKKFLDSEVSRYQETIAA